MSLSVLATRFFIRNLTLRVPFRYGIATMTRVPHLVVRLDVAINGRLQHGFAADNLPPKWFTKNPAALFGDEIAEMLEVTQSAAAIAQALPPAKTVFAWWREVARLQERWAVGRACPPLLSSFGVSLIERAVLDAFCRATGQSFGDAARNNAFGIRLGDVHPELGDAPPGHYLPKDSSRSLIVRHTVGLGDPLDIADSSGCIPDGLPHSLEEFIREQGLTHFKIKLGGDFEQDRTRLRRIADVIGRHASGCAFTLDGNENFQSVEPFRAFWGALQADHQLAPFLAYLIFVEQPFHRDVALGAQTATELLAWKDRPPMIIDESDARIDSVRVALASGYSGTSHKNCKGVLKGLANACLIEHRRRGNSHLPLHLSAEDLTNLGPIALPQDLAAVAAFGIPHAERNGHHYFAGLRQFPSSTQRDIQQSHGDLYGPHPDGYPAVRIEAGRVAIGSVVDAPFGVGFEPDLTDYTPLEDWTIESLQDAAAG